MAQSNKTRSRKGPPPLKRAGQRPSKSQSPGKSQAKSHGKSPDKPIVGSAGGKNASGKKTAKSASTAAAKQEPSPASSENQKSGTKTPATSSLTQTLKSVRLATPDQLSAPVDNKPTAAAAPPPLPAPKPTFPATTGSSADSAAAQQKSAAAPLPFSPPLPQDPAQTPKNKLPGTPGQLGIDAGAAGLALGGALAAGAGQDPRRTARRRPAAAPGPVMAANDDAPTIGGLIYAMEQKPSRRPFIGASIATGIWIVLGSLFGWAMLAPQFSKATGLLDLFMSPGALTVSATLLVPIATFWAIAMLIWRAQEMKLMSSAMTEVAVRLAEPDRTAEQSVASLGQAVRRQVSFMNDAVERALGRAGELEALVHAEVSSLEQSYSDNESRIRGLIDELSGERHALSNSSVEIVSTLKELGSEVPALIDKLNNQQIKLAHIIEGAGQNLTALETAIDTSTGRLETKLGERTVALQGVLQDYTGALDSVMQSRSEQMSLAFNQYVETLDTSIAERTDTLQTVFEEYAIALDTTLSNRTKLIDASVSAQAKTIDGTLTAHVDNFESTLTNRTQVIDSTLAAHVQTLDSQLAGRTEALNNAVTERLALFDETITRSTAAFDGAVGEKAQVITLAIENQARDLSDTLGRQASQIDETLMHGINSVRRTSESITKQSLQAIEGLANQSDLLKNVSEGILQQISNVTARFEDQGTSIMKAANQLDRANTKIDLTLQRSNQELSKTLVNVEGQTDRLDNVLQDYSSSLAGSLSEAEQRAKSLADAMASNAQEHSLAALADIEKLKVETESHANRALEDMRSKASEVSREVTHNMSSMASDFTDTSQDLRQRTHRVAVELEDEQRRLQEQMSALPAMTRESSQAVSNALQDQLRALEQLSSLSTRTTARSAVSGALSSDPPAPANGTAQPAQPNGNGLQASRQPLAAEPVPGSHNTGRPAQQTQALAAQNAIAKEEMPPVAAGLHGGQVPSAPAQQAPSPAPVPEQALHNPNSLTASISAQAGAIAAAQGVSAQLDETDRTLDSISTALSAAHAGSRNTVGNAGPAPNPVAAAPVASGSGSGIGQTGTGHSESAGLVARGQATSVQPAAQESAVDARQPDGWSVGDLLARASEPNAGQAAPLHPTAAEPEASDPGIDIEAMAAAMDQRSAAAIWHRLRTGQPAGMARNLYSPEGRATHDETLGRYRASASVRATIDQYLADFEHALHEAERAQQDPAIIEHTLTSEAGRVYLFLAHISGRPLQKPL